MKPTIVFYLRNNYINFRITANSQKVRKSTGLPIQDYTWDGKRIKGRSPYADKVNKKLRELEAAVELCDTLQEAERRVLSLLEPETNDLTLYDYCMVYENEVAAKLSTSSRAVYRSVFKLYGGFAEEEGDIYPVDFDLRSIQVYDRAKTIAQFEGHMHSFVSYMVEQGKKPGTQKVYLDKIKAVINWIRKKKGIDMPHEFEAPEVVT